MNVDFNKSLEELEQEHWDAPDFKSSLVEKCYQLRKLPLRELNTESYRILIGQNIGLKYLIPLAIKELQKNPLAEGDFYEGDLLCSVLTVRKQFWIENKILIKSMSKIVELVRKQINQTNPNPEVLSSINSAIKVFQENIDSANTRHDPN